MLFGQLSLLRLSWENFYSWLFDSWRLSLFIISVSPVQKWFQVFMIVNFNIWFWVLCHASFILFYVEECLLVIQRAMSALIGSYGERLLFLHCHELIIHKGLWVGDLNMVLMQMLYCCTEWDLTAMYIIWVNLELVQCVKWW